MTRFALILAAALVAAPVATSVAAQEPKEQSPLGEIAPLLDGLRGLMEGWAQDAMPLMQDLADKMSDLNAYEAPEVLPNGDIIIRRKPEAEPDPDAPPTPNADGSIDL